MTITPQRPLPGGPLAIDLLNTRWKPGDTVVDWLDHDDAVKGFAASYNYDLAPTDVADVRRSLTDARALIERLLQVAKTGEVDADTTVAVNQSLATATPYMTISPAGPILEISSQSTTEALSKQALVNAIELLATQPDRVRSCEHDNCTLWFVDTSKGGRRRWCSMERCGNRAKAQRHYSRSHDADDR